MIHDLLRPDSKRMPRGVCLQRREAAHRDVQALEGLALVMAGSALGFAGAYAIARTFNNSAVLAQVMTGRGDDPLVIVAAPLALASVVCRFGHFARNFIWVIYLPNPYQPPPSL
jgi:hypothetical protein